ncbi:hypothetical protein EAI_04358 [Harpegnathos saltator]|uniref:Uncharacterized protein n=1 Tax=Harpegnathos saltator TaxID=610380 RepID=E2BI07_HARSA|nr:hypothetical protein EAI_04358 [Harpegnathos saltator]
MKATEVTQVHPYRRLSCSETSHTLTPKCHAKPHFRLRRTCCKLSITPPNGSPNKAIGKDAPSAWTKVASGVMFPQNLQDSFGDESINRLPSPKEVRACQTIRPNEPNSPAPMATRSKKTDKPDNPDEIYSKEEAELLSQHIREKELQVQRESDAVRRERELARRRIEQREAALNDRESEMSRRETSHDRTADRKAPLAKRCYVT